MPTAATLPQPPARADVIDGKAFAAMIRERVAAHVAALAPEGLVPGLAVVLVGDNPASEVYVRNKARLSREAGMASFEHRLSAATTQAELLALITALNADPAVHGILVQLPLPAHIDERAALTAVSPEKDVDGFHPINVGRLATGQAGLVPCTPLGCMLMLRERHGPSLAGLDAVVVGRSNIVGKPMAQLLLAADATVTIAHSRTRDLPALCRRADILVAAVGRPQMILGSWVKPGATVIDVGINTVPAPERGEGRTRLVGDVDFDSAVEVAGAITPVPGGVGPMTIACLMANTVVAACRSAGLPVPPGLSL